MMRDIEGPKRRVAVFCSASREIESVYFEAVSEFVEGLADRGHELIYGGCAVGLMGHLASRALSAGVTVRGAITEGLAAGAEIANRDLHELAVVADLFERKRWMMERAHAFVIFPGGFGTLDEALEVITWKILGVHAKPIVFVNLRGFWQHQLEVFEEFGSCGMVRATPGAIPYEVCETVAGTWAVLDGSRKQVTL